MGNTGRQNVYPVHRNIDRVAVTFNIMKGGVLHLWEGEGEGWEEGELVRI